MLRLLGYSNFAFNIINVTIIYEDVVVILRGKLKPNNLYFVMHFSYS